MRLLGHQGTPCLQLSPWIVGADKLWRGQAICGELPSQVECIVSYVLFHADVCCQETQLCIRTGS